MPEKDAFLTLTLQDGSNPLVFASEETAIKHFKSERSLWNWLRNDQFVDPNLANDLINKTVPHFDNIINFITRLKNDRTALEKIKNSYNQIHVVEKVPTGDTALAKLIDSTRRKYPDVAANMLGIITKSKHLKFNTTSYAIAVFRLGAFKDGLTQHSMDAVTNSLEEFTTRHREVIADLVEEALKARQSHDRQLESAEERFDELEAEFRKNSEDRISSAQTDVQNAIDSIERTNLTYSEFMRLKAPADYWRDKGDIHLKTMRYRKNVLLWSAGLGSASLLVSLYCLISISSEAAKNDGGIGATLPWIAGGVVLTTIAFWGIRILVRLFLSEHRLWTDAREREILIQTYLALSQESKVSEEERILVLNGIFRRVSDGLIKDDAAPDLAAGSIISKILEPK